MKLNLYSHMCLLLLFHQLFNYRLLYMLKKRNHSTLIQLHSRKTRAFTTEAKNPAVAALFCSKFLLLLPPRAAPLGSLSFRNACLQLRAAHPAGQSKVVIVQAVIANPYKSYGAEVARCGSVSDFTP